MSLASPGNSDKFTPAHRHALAKAAGYRLVFEPPDDSPHLHKNLNFKAGTPDSQPRNVLPPCCWFLSSEATLPSAMRTVHGNQSLSLTNHSKALSWVNIMKLSFKNAC